MKCVLFFFLYLHLLFLLPFPLGETTEPSPPRWKPSLRQEISETHSYSAYHGLGDSREYSGGGKFDRFQFKTLLSLEAPDRTRMFLGVGLLYGRSRGGPFEGTEGGNSLNHYPSEYTIGVSRPFSGGEGGLSFSFPGKSARGPLFLRGGPPHPYGEAHWLLPLFPLSSPLPLTFEGKIRVRLHLSDQFLGGVSWKHPLNDRTDFKMGLAYLHTGNGLDLGGDSFAVATARLGYPPVELLRERYGEMVLTFLQRPRERFHYDVTLGQKIWGKSTPKTTRVALGLSWFLL